MAVDRRELVKRVGLSSLALTGGFLAVEEAMAQPAAVAYAEGKYVLPPLPYREDALEPHIDGQTMRLHHDLHHLGYVNGLNSALERLAQARQRDDMALVKHWTREVGFQGAGHFLHTIFWNNMSPEGGGAPKGELAARISKDFGSFTAFKAQFSAAATQVEGSGWGILAWEPFAKQLLVLQAEKHQNQTPGTVAPLLVLDVWEHAYYLKYQNRRADYVAAWWNVVNWRDVSRRLTVSDRS